MFGGSPLSTPPTSPRTGTPSGQNRDSTVTPENVASHVVSSKAVVGIIPRPSGTPGRKNSGGYNVKEEMRIDDDEYDKIHEALNSIVSKWLDHSKTITKQKKEAVERVKKAVCGHTLM